VKANFLLTLVAGASALAAVAIEPSATLFENDNVKVVRALEKPHVKGKAHEHKMNRVMVYLESGRQRFEYPDGRKPAVFDWTAGQVAWSPSSGMHAPEVISDSPFNIIEVELKNAGTGKKITSPRDPVKTDPKHYKVEFENDQVRAVRVTVGAHQTVAMHEHTLGRVTVFLTDQKVKVTGADGKSETLQRKAGDAIWGMPTSHIEENLADTPFDVIMVEIKS
jgi:beta-alanine degradation protein BauB